MTIGLFRVGLPDGTARLARGDTEIGPRQVLAPDLSVASLLGQGAGAFIDAAQNAPGVAGADDVRLLAPVDEQEIWAAGVTYERSREARMEESAEPSVYDRVYEARRPELFHKSAGWRVRGPVDAIGIRADSTWDVPEPELALIIGADMKVAGYTIGNDVSSRSIEGDNPLYLPQAKTYAGSCALGPCIVPADAIELPLSIALEVVRGGSVVASDETSSGRLHRTIEDLIDFLGRALDFPAGVVLLTGTGIIPPADFSLVAGDTVRITIDGLGTLENRVEVVGRPA